MALFQNRGHYLANYNASLCRKIWTCVINNRYICTSIIIISISVLTHLYSNKVLKYQYNQQGIIEKIVSLQTIYENENFLSYPEKLSINNTIPATPNNEYLSYHPNKDQVLNKTGNLVFATKNTTSILPSTSIYQKSSSPTKNHEKNILSSTFINEGILFDSIDITQLETDYKAALK